MRLMRTDLRRATRRQLEVPRVYIASGSIAAAAHELHISQTSARQHLSALYRRTGCINAVQAAFCLGAWPTQSSPLPQLVRTNGWRAVGDTDRLERVTGDHVVDDCG